MFPFVACMTAEYNHTGLLLSSKLHCQCNLTRANPHLVEDKGRSPKLSAYGTNLYTVLKSMCIDIERRRRIGGVFISSEQVSDMIFLFLD